MNKGNKTSWADAFGFVGTLGFAMVANVAVGIFLGRWLDEQLMTRPWFTVGGIVLGLIAGLWGSYKRIIHRDQ